MQVRKQQLARTGSKNNRLVPNRKRSTSRMYMSPCLFNLYAEYISEVSGWMKYKLESRLPGEISITLDMQIPPLLWQKAKKN